MGGGDGDRARHIVLRAADLPGEGWEAVADPELPTEPDPDDDLEGCLTGFPDADVTASATSPRFTRGDALAWSVAWVLAGEGAAGAAYTRLADEGFASCFVAATAAEVDPHAGAATLLGPVGEPVEEVAGPHHGARHRARLTAATAEGLLAIHLELVALQRERAVTLVILADSPDPVPPAHGRAVARRVAARLATT
ncbi:MAG: hypothetical protein ACRDZ9_07340 [Acidimicrobiales bacterium]